MTDQTSGTAAAKTETSGLVVVGAAPEVAPAVSGTLLEATAPETPAAPAAETASWRDRIAGDDKDFRKRLDRFADETAFARSYRALEQKLSSGEYKQAIPFPDKGTPEQQAEWRKAQGVPDKPEAYDVNLGNGAVWGENDKPILNDFLAHAHGRNYTPDQVKANLEWYHSLQEKMAAHRAESDGAFKRAAEDTLRAEWGGEYRRNEGAFKNLIAGWSKEAREALFGGRTESGELIGNHPAVLKEFARLALEVNPAPSLLPSGGADAKSIDTRIGELQTMQRDRGSAYWRGDMAAKLQAEYRNLVDARDRNKNRAA